ncbi:putative sterol carrier protein [Cytobacillus firmus]|uniref:Putative sterol carrier protein n=2 Tax=Cytobacillus TaxID=2675230 RepID=A0A366JX22_CYTFI|nr:MULTISPECIES: SCP2 sterol-binding domain-containing protein [Cytobacillus]RBP93116.1 putative sterol carrier protein [Cytobacillus firmus]TDX42718.1 putative sterol carrier protein [Cytobacillus oceanisediminis]
MAVKDELNQLADKMNADPVHIKDEKNRVFQVDLEESGPIQILLKEGKVIVEDGAPHEPEVTLGLSEKNFSKLLKDDLNTTMAFMTGSLKVDGKMGLALKLQEIVKKYQ